MALSLSKEDVVIRKHRGHVQLGLVTYSYTGDSSSEDEEDEDDPSNIVKEGEVRIAWYPKGHEEVVSEDKIILHDRSLLPGDIVRWKGEGQLQKGLVKSIKVMCNLQVLNTKQIIYNIPSEDLLPIGIFQPNDYVVFDNWVGVIRDNHITIVTRFKNDARGALTEDDASRLVDVYDYSDENSIFGEEVGFFPGQTLHGPGTAFRSAKWLGGPRPILGSKSRFRVLVDEVKTVGLDIQWKTRAVSKGEGDLKPPPQILRGKQLEKVKILNFNAYARVQLGDKYMYTVKEDDITSPEPVSKGSLLCFKKPEKDFVKEADSTAKVLDKSIPSGETLPSSLESRQSISAQQISDALEKENLPPLSATFKSASKESLGSTEPGRRDARTKHDGSLAAAVDIASPQGQSAAEHSGNELKVEALEEINREVFSIAKQLQASGNVTSSKAGEVLSVLNQCKDKETAITALKNILNTSQISEKSNVLKIIESLVEIYVDVNSMITAHEKGDRSAEAVGQSYQKTLASTRDDILSQLMALREITATETEKNESGDESSGEEIVEDEEDEEVADGSGEEEGPVDVVRPKACKTGGRRPCRQKTAGQQQKRRKDCGRMELLKPGQAVCVEVTHTATKVDVLWQDGTFEKEIISTNVVPCRQLDDLEFFPGDFVIQGKESEDNAYGIVMKTNGKERTCSVNWIVRDIHNTESSAAEMRSEDESVYELSPHPDLMFGVDDLVVRIALTREETEAGQDLPPAGQVQNVNGDGTVRVRWIDNSYSNVWPNQLFKIEEEFDSEFSFTDDLEVGSKGDSDNKDEESEDSVSSSDGSWETASEEESVDDEKEGDEELEEGARAPDESLTKTEPPDTEAEKTGEVETEDQTDEPVSTTSDCSVLQQSSADIAHKEEHTPPHEGQHTTQEKGEVVKVKCSSENIAGQESVAEHEDVAKQEGVTKQQGVAKLKDLAKLEGVTKEEGVAKLEGVVNQEGAASQEGVANQDGVARLNVPGPGNADNERELDELQSPNAASRFIMDTALPSMHHYSSTQQPGNSKQFLQVWRKEVRLLQTALPRGILIKGFEDRMDLFSVMIEGPVNTPYEDGVFFFDIRLLGDYPKSPPLVHYLSFCTGRLNPNLYHDGKVCLSLLGTWSGKGNEMWTSSSNLLQLLVSIQGLILVSEPYYNEAGYEKHRGTAESLENCRMYNEMAVVKVVQSMTRLVQSPPCLFKDEARRFCEKHSMRLMKRLESWLDDDIEEPVTTATPSSQSSHNNLQPTKDSENSTQVGGNNGNQHPGPQDQPEARTQESRDTRTRESRDTIVSAHSLPPLPLGTQAVPITSITPSKNCVKAQGRSIDQSHQVAPFSLFPLSRGFVLSLRKALREFKAVLNSAGIS